MRPTHLNARRTLALGRATMVLSVIGMIAATLVAYPFAERFGMGMQITGHLVLPISAAFFKIGYVVRLASHHALGNMSAG
ncbi:hypothetical protein [Aromatoleum petrolei]|uniref:Uncharacterized protein n=1 Tax=Aromatoleum petrolei TaxID=76116 RepID=A0ABX1MVH8_9RHOO|nr:hypothetical protein [Aromatoleum petrolei]NMF89097.1 hypothetical protein [Aromatoleum petrolei]QTQ38311.1 Uncharacterized protein ToN1_42080 [Aromatoleum petrolei]